MKYLFIFLTLAVTLQSCVDKEVRMENNPADLSSHVGKQITLEGEVSGIMWQHMMTFMPGYPYEHYLDWNSTQIVFYTKVQMNCKGKTRITGKLIEVSGAGKGEGPDNLHSEYQVLADIVECEHSK